MGLSPDEVLDMSMHDYEAALHHFAKAQGADDDEPALEDDEFDEMMVGLAAHEQSQARH